ERALFHAQDFIGALLDEFRDGIAVHGAACERLEDQHVQGALEERLVSHKRFRGSMRSSEVECKGMLAAITREVSPPMEACELTHFERQPIDIDLARAQHA